MTENELKSMYDRMTVSDSDSIRIRNQILSAGSEKKRRILHLLPAAAVLAGVLLLIPDVRISAAEFLRSVSCRLFSGNASVSLELKEQPVFTDISLPALFNEIPEAEEVFGINLLDTADESCRRSGKETEIRCLPI